MLETFDMLRDISDVHTRALRDVLSHTSAHGKTHEVVKFLLFIKMNI